MSSFKILNVLMLFALACKLCDGNISLGQCRMSLTCDEDTSMDASRNNHRDRSRIRKVGPKGSRGEQGPPGAKGDSVKGDIGKQGVRGIQGLVGQKGEPGQSCRCPHVEALKDELAVLVARLNAMEESLSWSDCSNLRNKSSGVYQIQSIMSNLEPITVMCDMDTAQGGWTVFQRRINGSVDFYKDWEHYVNGFGSVYGEHWLGLESLHQLTTNHDMMLRVDLEDRDGNTAYAQYSTFRIAGAEDNYRLTVHGYTGNAKDSLEYHNGMQFSTCDRDNDIWTGESCASGHGAWWYKNCQVSNLNGNYSATTGTRGLSWYHWKTSYDGVKSVKMMIRRI